MILIFQALCAQGCSEGLEDRREGVSESTREPKSPQALQVVFPLGVKGPAWGLLALESLANGLEVFEVDPENPALNRTGSARDFASQIDSLAKLESRVIRLVFRRGDVFENLFGNTEVVAGDQMPELVGELRMALAFQLAPELRARYDTYVERIGTVSIDDLADLRSQIDIAVASIPGMTDAFRLAQNADIADWKDVVVELREAIPERFMVLPEFQALIRESSEIYGVQTKGEQGGTWLERWPFSLLRMEEKTPFETITATPHASIVLDDACIRSLVQVSSQLWWTPDDLASELSGMIKGAFSRRSRFERDSTWSVVPTSISVDHAKKEAMFCLVHEEELDAVWIVVSSTRQWEAVSPRTGLEMVNAMIGNSACFEGALRLPSADVWIGMSRDGALEFRRSLNQR